jgi:excisionase family DNA binding protein
MVITCLTTAEAAEILGVSTRTLEKWRMEGGGPKYVRLSPRCIRYRLRELDEFLKTRLRENTYMTSA